MLQLVQQLGQVPVAEAGVSSNRPANWPVKPGWLASSGTNVTVPVIVPVTWRVPSFRSVVWMTPENTIVSVPGAPEQGFAEARESMPLN